MYYRFCAGVILLAIIRRQERDSVPRDFQILFVILWQNSVCVKFSHSWCIKDKPITFKPPDLRTCCECSINVFTSCRTLLGLCCQHHCTVCALSPQVQSTSWMPHQQYVMQPTVSTVHLQLLPETRLGCLHHPNS